MTSSAAPGVDHAVITGIRVHRLRPTQVSPLPGEIAQIQDVVCPGLRCPVCAAVSTTISGPE